MIARSRRIAEVRHLLKSFPVVGLLGARQVGKSTLARQVAAASRGAVSFFDLEDPETLARLARRPRIEVMLPIYAAELDVLRSLGYRTEPSGFVLVGRTYHPPLTLEWVKERWWYTFGDFDLV